MAIRAPDGANKAPGLGRDVQVPTSSTKKPPENERLHLYQKRRNSRALQLHKLTGGVRLT